MKENESNVKDTKKVHTYNMKVYERKLLINGIIVSTLIILSVLLIFYFIMPTVFNGIIIPMINNLYEKSVFGEIDIYKRFLLKTISENLYTDSILIEARELVQSETTINLSSLYDTLYYIYNLTAAIAMLIIGTLLSFYIRSNADTMILGLGVKQKEGMIKALIEDLMIDEKRAIRKLEIEKMKNDIRQEWRKFEIERAKEKVKVKIERMKEKKTA